MLMWAFRVAARSVRGRAPTSLNGKPFAFESASVPRGDAGNRPPSSAKHALLLRAALVRRRQGHVRQIRAYPRPIADVLLGRRRKPGQKALGVHVELVEHPRRSAVPQPRVTVGKSARS